MCCPACLGCPQPRTLKILRPSPTPHEKTASHETHLMDRAEGGAAGGGGAGGGGLGGVSLLDVEREGHARSAYIYILYLYTMFIYVLLLCSPCWHVVNYCIVETSLG